MTGNSKEEILTWIDASLKKEDIENYTVLGLGGSDKGEGYIADVLFVKVKGNKISNGKSAELNLVLKVSKSISLFKESLALYERELYVYSQVFPILRKFELEKDINNIFNSIPKCLKTINSEGKQIVVLENLKSEGYELHEYIIPMNLPHIKTVLRSYAKFHALSFAFKDQKKVEFENLTSDYTSIYKIIANSEMKDLLQLGATKSYEMIKKMDTDLAEKIYKLVIERGICNALNEVFDSNVEEVVITHGDCWNNNFMFQYEDGNKESPAKVAMLDWQNSSIHSPILDIAYFLFFVSSEEQVSRFDDLLKYYHSSLSEFLAELGSDTEKIFSCDTMIKHWKQFSKLGLLYSLSFMEMLTCAKEDALDLNAYQNKDDLTRAAADIETKDRSIFSERLLATSRYYFMLADE